MAIPMRSPAAERRRPTPWDAVAALAVIAFAVVLIVLLRPTQGSAITAVVTLDGEPVAQYRLDQMTQPETLTVDEAP